MSAPTKPAGKVLATITLEEKILLDPHAEPQDLQEGEPDPNVITRLELGPLRGEMLRRTPNAKKWQTGDLWAIGGRMAGIPEERMRHVLGEMYAPELGQLSAAVGEALKPYQAQRFAEQTFDPHRTHSIDLEEPVKLGSETVRKIEFPRMKGAHMWEAPPDLPLLGDLLEIAETHTGKPSVLFDRLGAADCGRVVAVVSHFLGGLLSTGG